MFDELIINDYANFKNFSIYFKNNKSNLNILIGRNGSGKSSLLDAIFKIGENNLVNQIDKNVDETKFEYMANKERKTVLPYGKRDIDNVDEFLWDKVVRFYTGNTARQFTTNNKNVISLSADDAKWALAISFLKGNIKNNNFFQEAIKLISENNYNEELIDPKFVWIEISYDFIEEYKIEFDHLKIQRPTFERSLNNGNIRIFWDIDNIKIDKENVLIDNFIKLLDLVNSKWLIDTGFIYYPDKYKEQILLSSLLSDGEFGFISRMALYLVLATVKGKSLFLFDEPETHFNETWKSKLIWFVEKIFNNKHDVFIATHSAMLISDARPDELHRLENVNGCSVCHPSPINTYGANIIDIGQIMFKMEGNIGERAREDIEKAINGRSIDQIDKKLQEVGPGEYRWRLRARKKHLEEQKQCKKPSNKIYGASRRSC